MWPSSSAGILRKNKNPYSEPKRSKKHIKLSSSVFAIQCKIQHQKPCQNLTLFFLGSNSLLVERDLESVLIHFENCKSGSVIETLAWMTQHLQPCLVITIQENNALAFQLFLSFPSVS